MDSLPFKGSWIAVCILLMAASLCADETFPVLKIGSQTYSNVLVTGKNKKTVFIQHEKGIATLKVKELPDDIAKALGYELEAPPKKVDLTERLQLDPRVLQWQEQITGESKAWLEKISPVQVGILLGGIFLVYLFFCQCCRLICLKAGHRPGVLVWLPILKLFPLLRAAGMSGWCFFLMFLPVVNLIMTIVWSVKICNARQKSPVLALFLLLPVTNLFVFLYLAFSEGMEVEQTPQRIQFA